MDREDSNRKQDDARNTRQGNEGSHQESDADDNFSGDSGPSHKVRQGNTRRLKNFCKRFRPLGPLRETVYEESIPDN